MGSPLFLEIEHSLYCFLYALEVRFFAENVNSAHEAMSRRLTDWSALQTSQASDNSSSFFQSICFAPLCARPFFLVLPLSTANPSTVVALARSLLLRL